MNIEPQNNHRNGSLERRGAETALTIQPLAQRSMFWRPAYLEQSAWLEHIPFAFWLIEAHRPRVFVELGVHRGVSYFAFCQAVEKLGLDTRCFAVDSWEESSGDYDKVKDYNEAQYSGFSRLVRSSFDDALDYFTDGSVDLLHIDGLHTLEAVTHDFESWLPKMSDRGVVILHASNVRERNCGVYKLFERLQEQYPSFELIHGDGLAVLGVGSERNELLQSLFRSNQIDSAKRAVNEVFSRLGRACADSFAARKQQELAGRLKARETELARQTALWEEASSEVMRLKALIDTQAETLRSTQTSDQVLSAQITQLTRDLSRSVEEIASANTAAMEAQRKNMALHQQAVVRESELAALRRTLDESAAETARLRQTLSEKEQSLEAAQRQLEQQVGLLQEKIQDLSYSGEARSRELATLNRLLEEREATLEASEKSTVAERQRADRLADETEKLRSEQQDLRKSLDDRFEELATLTGLLDEREAGRQASDQEAAALRPRVEKLENELKIKTEALDFAQKKLAESVAAGSAQAQNNSAIVRLEAENRRLRSEQEILSRKLEERFREIATLTMLLDEHSRIPAAENPVGESREQTAADSRDAAPARLKAPLRDFIESFTLPKGIKAQMATIEQSGLFDKDWYRRQYPDIAETGANPIKHYIRFGAAEGRNPGPDFDTNLYLARHPGLINNGINPLVHYIQHKK